MGCTTKGLVSISYFYAQFPVVQISFKDCYLTKEIAEWTVKLVSKGLNYYIKLLYQARMVKMYLLGSVKIKDVILIHFIKASFFIVFFLQL